MHAPDGFYSVGLCLTFDGIFLGFFCFCIKRVWKKIDRSLLRVAAAIGAFVFAVEMTNFCVSRGSSCHFMGGVFASILLGPFISTIMVSMMHFVQFFVFQDGGLLSLGPNLFTIVIISTFLGYYIYRVFKSLVMEPYGTYIGAFISAWLTLLITAIAVCVMLDLSGVDSLAVTLGPMVGPHVMLGVLEGLFTVILLMVKERFCPGFLALRIGKLNKCPPSYYKRIWYGLFLLALIVGVAVSPFASRKPDGLQKLAIDLGFKETHERVYYRAPMADYFAPGITDKGISRGVAGLMGVVITFILCWFVGYILASGQRQEGEEVSAKEVFYP